MSVMANQSIFHSPAVDKAEKFGMMNASLVETSPSASGPGQSCEHGRLFLLRHLGRGFIEQCRLYHLLPARHAGDRSRFGSRAGARHIAGMPEMKKSFAVSGLMIAVAIGLSACESKTSGEQFVDCVEQKSTRKEQDKCMEKIKPSDKEREQMDELRKKRQEAYDEVLGRKKGSAENK